MLCVQTEYCVSNCSLRNVQVLLQHKQCVSGMDVSVSCIEIVVLCCSQCVRAVSAAVNIAVFIFFSATLH